MVDRLWMKSFPAFITWRIPGMLHVLSTLPFPLETCQLNQTNLYDYQSSQYLVNWAEQISVRSID